MATEVQSPYGIVGGSSTFYRTCQACSDHALTRRNAHICDDCAQHFVNEDNKGNEGQGQGQDQGQDQGTKQLHSQSAAHSGSPLNGIILTSLLSTTTPVTLVKPFDACHSNRSAQSNESSSTSAAKNVAAKLSYYKGKQATTFENGLADIVPASYLITQMSQKVNEEVRENFVAIMCKHFEADKLMMESTQSISKSQLRSIPM